MSEGEPMKTAIRISVLLTAVTLCAIAAEASIEPSVRDVYEHGCVLDMSTAACFGYSTPVGAPGVPTMTACTARASQNQRCRDCRSARDEYGNDLGIKACAFVSYSASCVCKYPNTANCRPEGSCTYSP
jgi:hypothetical protein